MAGEKIVSNDVLLALATGQARYNIICNEAGGIIDDALVYRDGDTRLDGGGQRRAALKRNLGALPGPGRR